MDPGKKKGHKKMAQPQIISVTPSKTKLAPGEIFRITVVASDPDSASGGQTIVVKDKAGNVSLPVTVTLTVEDPLTVEIQDTDGLGIVYTPDPSNPMELIGQVPV